MFKKAFTLIELLVVIGILAVLLAITLVAINPAQQFQKANDTKRKADVNAILNAINQYQTNNSGQLPAGITTTAAEIGAGGAGQVDLCSILVPTYMAAMPADPLVSNGAPVTSPCPASYTTGYFVQLSSATGNRVGVYANQTQLASPTIYVMR